MKKICIVAVGTITVFACLLFCAPASAYYLPHGFPMLPAEGVHPVYGNGTWINTTLNGSVYFDGGHGLDNPLYVQEFDLPDYADEILFAHIYMYVWGGNRDNRGWQEVNFTNATGETKYLGRLWLNGTEDENPEVWDTSCGAHIIWHNVTHLATTGTNTVEVNTGNQPGGWFDGRIDNLHMIAVYRSDIMPEIRVWVVQGHESLSKAYEDFPRKDWGIAYFNGSITPLDPWKSALFYTAFEAGDAGKTDEIYFNDHLLCTDCANGSTYPQYMDLEVFDVLPYLNENGQHVDWWRDGDDYQHNINAVLVLSRERPRADFVVEKMDEPILAVEHNYTLALVAGHEYKINATIKNTGPATANASNATLCANGTIVDAHVPRLGYGQTAELQFSWTPSAPGTYTLNVTADAFDQVNESVETNNVRTKEVYVYPSGGVNDRDLVMTQDDMKFLPTYEWHTANNKTTVLVNITNNGTTDITPSFTVRLTAPGTTQDRVITSGVSAKAGKETSFLYDAPKGGPYDVAIVLDANNDITSEWSEANNEITKQLNVIGVRIMNTHRYGDTSTYNGILSDYEDVDMFDIVKLVPVNCSTWDVLNSVADIKEHPSMAPGNTYVWGIGGLNQMVSSPEGSIYWYQYVNGIYLPLNQKCGDYKVHDGETMHWDIHVAVQAEKEEGYNPRTVMSWNALYPEPMTHGYWNMETEEMMHWDTTIVYPDESPDYLYIANNIRDKLVARGVPSDRIGIETDISITNDTKNTTNLILLGTCYENDLIAEINPYHDKFAMVVYFNTSSGKIIDDFTDTEYDHGGVVLACDNPYDNQPLGSEDSHKDEGPMIYTASGLNDSDAKGAAEMLIEKTGELNRFWLVKEIIPTGIFDTGRGTYPSISGVHEGNFTPKCNIEVRKIYTYPCTGTGGHSERVIFYDGEDEIINESWNGYQGDYHNITVSPPVNLSRGKEYGYKIITGSYPQIIHSQSYDNENGTITCTEFIDANGKRYNDWIPAIKLF